MEKPLLATSNTNEYGTSPARPTEIDLSQIITLLHTQYPNFTADSSIKKITFNISEDKETRKRRNAERRARLDFTDEQRSEHFAQKLQEYDEDTDNVLTELYEWHSGFMMWEERSPNLSDYAQKRKEIQDALKALVPRLNPESLFRGGADDTARCGQLLIFMEKEWAATADKEKMAVCHMFSLQWLIRQQAVDCTETSETIDEVKKGNEETPLTVNSQNEEDEETAALRKLLVEKLHIPTHRDNRDIAFGDKTYSQGQILAMVHEIYKKQEKPWTKSYALFGNKVAPLLNTSSKSIQMKISRALKDMKKVPLDNITISTIEKETGCNRIQAGKRFEKWDGLYEIVSLQQTAPTTPLRNASTNVT